MNKGPTIAQPATNPPSHSAYKPSNANPFARNTNNAYSPPPNNAFKTNSNDTSSNSLLSRIQQNEKMIDMLMRRVQCLEEQIEKGEFGDGDSPSNSIEVKKPSGEVIKTNGGFNNIINKLKDIHGREIQDRGMKPEPGVKTEPFTAPRPGSMPQQGALPQNNPGNWNNNARLQ